FQFHFCIPRIAILPAVTSKASSCSPVAKSAKTKITKSALVASSEAFELKAITSSLSLRYKASLFSEISQKGFFRLLASRKKTRR
ncbi:hypothetical protein, partial [Staphylococcus aureus]|uniref:hypothetical protein n=1 Tax=Staphylococcus aureus TaxID=1280 RepID=UPI003CFA553A